MPADTTNGLPYPVGSDALGDIDTIVQDLAQTTDDLILAAWDSWTPSFTSSGTTPNLGSTGTKVGKYRKRGRTVDFRIKLTYGGTGIAGTGNFNLDLPVLPVSTMDDVAIGSAVMFDSSVGAAGRFAGTVFCVSPTTPSCRIALGGSGGGIWTATNPFAPAAGDVISLSGTYEAGF